MFNISLNRVHDSVRISEGDERLTLLVDGDAMRMVAALTEAQRTLKGLTEESTEKERMDAAMAFAIAIFGPTQAWELAHFYHDDPACVISVCGKYFSQRLAGLIEKAQKRAK